MVTGMAWRGWIPSSTWIPKLAQAESFESRKSRKRVSLRGARCSGPSWWPQLVSAFCRQHRGAPQGAPAPSAALVNEAGSAGQGGGTGGLRKPAAMVPGSRRAAPASRPAVHAGRASAWLRSADWRRRSRAAGACDNATFPHQYWQDWAQAPLRTNAKTYSACCDACAATPVCVRFSVWSAKPAPCRMFNTSAPESELVTVAGISESTILASSQSERAPQRAPLHRPGR